MAPTTRSQTRRAAGIPSPSPAPEPSVPPFRRRRHRSARIVQPRASRDMNGRYIHAFGRSVAMMRVEAGAFQRIPTYGFQEAHFEPHELNDNIPIAARTRSQFAMRNVWATPFRRRREGTPVYLQTTRDHAVSNVTTVNRIRVTRMRSSPSSAVASMDALMQMISNQRSRITTGRFISVDEMLENIHGRQVEIIDPNEISEDEESEVEASTSAATQPESKKRRPLKRRKGRDRAKICEEPIRTPTLTACIICCEDIPKRPVACRTCRQLIGCRYCVKKWFRTTNLSHLDARPPFAMSVSHRNHHSCPLCRAPWDDDMEVIRVVNQDGIPFSQKDISMDTSDVPDSNQVSAV